MYLFIKFTHLIAAMVYFGLPIAFGRWYQTVSREEHGVRLSPTLAKMKLFTFLHLNFCGFWLLGTGWWLAHIRGEDSTRGWLLLGLVGLGLTLVNVNFNLGWSLHQLARRLHQHGEISGEIQATRRRIIWFSASHHTLVTLVTAVMVYKPPWF